MDAITICAANYLPFAQVLGNSFLDKNPNSTFSILVIDQHKVHYSRIPRFNYFSPSDLDLPDQVFENMTLYYTVTELATALKPSALKMLFKNGSKNIVYLDPDIEVFDNLIELESELEKNSIVLTPHSLQPIPRDGLRPTEADILSSGTFNLGFIALSYSDVSIALLDWWEERLRFDSISDPEEMLFTDQRWIDLVPSYFPYSILDHPGYNVAYWNLHERQLSSHEGQVLVNGKTLKFFHFSGYRPETPWILSKYVANKPRVVISGDEFLKNLCQRYGKLITDAGWQNEGALEYGYLRLGNGREIPSSLRRLYREDCIAAFKEGQTLEPPSDWHSWAKTRSIESGNLSRILFSLWKSRPDLQRRFPDATGVEAEHLQDWAKKHGVSEKVIDEDFIEILNLNGQSIPKISSNKKGISVAGYLNGEFGLGQSARLILESSKLTTLPVATLNSRRTTSRQSEKFTAEAENLIHPFIISIVNADQFKLWVEDIGRKNLNKSRIVGVWAWETEDFPKNMHDAFEYVDEIWAVSNFVKAAIAKHTKKPIYVFPTPVLKPVVLDKLNREQISLSDSAVYNLFIFDYLSVFNRKNPLGVVNAHKLAFPNEDGPTLVIKSTNGDSDAINREKLRFAIQNRKDILLIENYMSREQLTALINECSTYISLHRSEGYGLTMAEAMSLGKPVVATGYSGNLDFMNNHNSKLIPFKMVKIGPNSFPYLSESSWAEPDVEVAAQEIRQLHLDKFSREKLGQIASETILSTFTLQIASEFILKRYKYHHGLRANIFRSLSHLGKYRKRFLILIKTIYRAIKTNFRD